METIREANKESGNFTILPTECLVQFGHSIEKGANDKWYLTRLLQTVEELGVAPDGFKKFVRTGKREPVNPSTTNAIVGGGVVNTAATVEIYRQLAERGEAPKVVVHCGGRAGYLDKAALDNPTISEGKVMQEAFNSRLGEKPESQVLIEHGKTTEDDMRDGLDVALRNGCKSVTYVGLEIRLPRCKVFYEKITGETNKFNGITVNFVSAEDVIGDIARRKGRTAQWEKVLGEYKGSEGYKRTLEAELGGIQALKSGTYGQSLGGTGKT